MSLRTLHLSQDLTAQIHAHCEAAYPHECCGALIGKIQNGDKFTLRAEPLENAEPNSPERRFVVDPAELNALEQTARAEKTAIIGFYHSHPDSRAKPSSTDLEWAWPVYSYVIVSVGQGAVADTRSFSLDEEVGQNRFLEEALSG